MNQIETNAAAQAQLGAEQRGAQRFILLIRTAKLVCESGEFICVVRDVSETGLRVRLFHDLPADRRMALELGNGEVYFIEKVWENDQLAGFQFSAPIDVQGFIAEVSPYPRRHLRLRMQVPATVSLDGTANAATIFDFSQNGARIETSRHIGVGQKVRLDAEHLPPLTGTICWRSGQEYGLALEQFFSLEGFALLSAELQLTGASSAPVRRTA
jgi:PilZ domain